MRRERRVSVAKNLTKHNKTQQNTTKHNKTGKRTKLESTTNKKKEQNCKNFEKKIPSLTFRLEDHVHGHLPRRKKNSCAQNISILLVRIKHEKIKKTV